MIIITTLARFRLKFIPSRDDATAGDDFDDMPAPYLKFDSFICRRMARERQCRFR